MEIRKANINDIDAIVANRLEFIQNQPNLKIMILDEFKRSTYEFMKEHMADESMVVWTAVEEDRIVSTAIVCYNNLLPMMSNHTGMVGYILNVYTLPEFRNRGLATELINRIKQDAKERKVGKLYLDATDLGRPVYEKLGFEKRESGMVYNIGK